MQEYRDHIVAGVRARADAALSVVAEAQKRLADADLNLQEALTAVPIATSRVDEFVRTVRPAPCMPGRGEFFVQLLSQFIPAAPELWEMWGTLGVVSIVSDPTFGYELRFTADADGLEREGDLSREFTAGDILEYLGVGPPPALAPGDPITITRKEYITGREHVVLRRALPAFANTVGRQDRRESIIDCGRGRMIDLDTDSSRAYFRDDWPPISGRVVSITPRCSAFTVPKGGLSLEDLEAKSESPFHPSYFALREVFLPLEPEQKAAAKKK